MYKLRAYIYIYIYICIHMHTYIYIYILVPRCLDALAEARGQGRRAVGGGGLNTNMICHYTVTYHSIYYVIILNIGIYYII